MALVVLGEVIRAEETTATDLALKAFLSSMSSAVAGELVGAGKAAVAVFPGAGERLLAGVSAFVGLQVGRLVIRLSTAFAGAGVRSSAFWGTRHRLSRSAAVHLSIAHIQGGGVTKIVSSLKVDWSSSSARWRNQERRQHSKRRLLAVAVRVQRSRS